MRGSARRGRGRGGRATGRRSATVCGGCGIGRTRGRWARSSLPRGRLRSVSIRPGAGRFRGLLLVLNPAAFVDRGQLALGRRETRRASTALRQLEPEAIEDVAGGVDVPVDLAGAHSTFQDAVQGLLLARHPHVRHRQTGTPAARAALRRVVLVDEYHQTESCEESAELPDGRRSRADRVVWELGGPERPDHAPVVSAHGVLGRLSREP